MGKIVFIVSVLIVSFGLVGCGKKQPSLEEMQEPLSMEALSAINTTAQTLPEPKIIEAKAPLVTKNVSMPSQPALQPLPPSGPYKPTVVEIQTALRNAGYYSAAVDGKIGPLTKKAIEDFQKANGLEIDGKIGPKTWVALSSYLNPPAKAPQASAPGKKKR